MEIYSPYLGRTCYVNDAKPDCYTPEGKSLWLIHDAYVTDDGNGDPYYTAVALDVDGNDYDITWQIKLLGTEYDECDDESDACDWTLYTVTRGG